MASVSKKVTIGSIAANGVPFSTDVKGTGDQAALAVTFAAALAVLVADGASPTQAHVTTANTAYTALAATLGGDINVTVNTTTVNTRNKLNHFMDVLKYQFESMGLAP